jgi:hypothetical protein
MPSTPCTPAADYRTDAPRVDGWTPARQAAFLMTLSETGLVSQACAFAEMSVASAYALRREPRGAAFALGWQAAHLLARDRLEDVLLEAAITGVESVSTRVDGVMRRRTLNGNLSMAVLGRLDKRAAALDDRAIAVARSIGAAFEAFLTLVLDGGKADAIAAFLKAHPDPLAAQVAAYGSSLRAERGNPVQPSELDCRASLAMTTYEKAPILVEKSDIFSSPAMPGQPMIDLIPALQASPIPCSCPADRELALLDAA